MDVRVPQRQCVACKARKEKSDLFRIIKQNDTPLFCTNGHAQGRSVYFCKDKSCIMAGKKKNLASKSLKMHVEAAVYDQMIEAL